MKEERPDADFRGTTEAESTTQIGLERNLEVVKAGFWHLVNHIMRGDAPFGTLSPGSRFPVWRTCFPLKTSLPQIQSWIDVR